MTMMKYPRPCAEGGIFVSNEEFMDLLDHVTYSSPLYDKLREITLSAYPGLTAQLPKQQIAFLKKLDEIQEQYLNQKRSELP